MKKIFLFICCAALVTACNKDDDSGKDNSNDQIIGKWYLASIDGGDNLDLSATDCNKQSYIDFKSDNTADSAYYSDDSGDCTAETSNSTWSNNTGGKYTFNIPIYNLGSQKGTVEFNGSSSFTFYPDFFPGASIVFEKR